MKVLYVILFLIFFCDNLNAQQRAIDWAFRLSLQDTKATYEKPKGFQELDSMVNIYCVREINDVFEYSIINRRADVVIRFTGIRINFMTERQIINIKKMFNINYVTPANENYLNTINLDLQGDTAGKITFYSKDYAKKNFNADVGGEFNKVCQTVYKDKFYKSRVVFIHKENNQDVADWFIHYFYEDGKEQKAKRYIRRTVGMLKFQ